MAENSAEDRNSDKENTRPDEEKYCCICKYYETNEKVESLLVKIGRKQIDTFKQVSATRKDDLGFVLNTHLEVYAHEKCRKMYTKEPYTKFFKLKTELKYSGPPPKRTRSSTKAFMMFDWTHLCFICSGLCNSDTKLPIKYRKAYSSVQDDEVVQNMLRLIEGYGIGEFQDVFERLSSVESVIEHGGKYHRICYTNMLKRCSTTDGNKLESNPVDKSMTKIFDFINNNPDCQFTFEDLLEVIEGERVPAIHTITDRLKKQYGDEICFVTKNGCKTIIHFKEKQRQILSHQWYEEQKTKSDEEKDNAILQAAKNILRKRINEANFVNGPAEYQPAETSFGDINKDIPKELIQFLEDLIYDGKKLKKVNQDIHQTKVSAIAHSIVSACRPKSFFSPLLLSVGVTIHRTFGSKKMVNALHSLGMSCSYNEVRRYEASVALQKELNIDVDAFIQFAYDNADFNVDTLDGKHTFHNLGGIQIVTPGSKVNPREPIERLSKLPSAENMAKTVDIPLETRHVNLNAGFKSLKFNLLQKDLQLKLSENSDIRNFWMFLKHNSNLNFEGWNGYMEKITSDNSFEISIVDFLPFIYSPPSDIKTLFTCLRESCDRAINMGMKTCIITFDQPLYHKARGILAAVPDSFQNVTVVLRLGGFHSILSFLGVFGHIMAGSGLKEVMAKCYAENSIDLMLQGKAYSRAVRAHHLIQLALSIIIFKEIELEDENFKVLKNSTQMTDFDADFNTNLDAEFVKTHEIYSLVTTLFKDKLKSLEARGKTSKLWVTYFRMVSLLFDFISAERQGDWVLHLETLQLMIPFFHAAGHFPYAKSAQIYLQDMKGLQATMDLREFEKLTSNGYWTCRRTNKFFAGLPTDQTIEQTLMKQVHIGGGIFKTSSGESNVAKFVQGKIDTASIIGELEKFCGVNFDSSHQHADATDARIKRDATDTKLIVDFFVENNPFPVDKDLISLSTGMIADETINVQNSFEIGVKTMEKYDGCNYLDLSFSRKNNVRSILMMESKIQIFGEEVPVDTQALFQRMCIMKKTDDDLSSYFEFELAPYPVALFDTNGMRKNEKSKLYELLDPLDFDCFVPKSDFTYVIDGGMLLHRVKMSTGKSFSAICEDFYTYININYGHNVSIVFDGYDDDGTKSAERKRRSKRKPSTEFRLGLEKKLEVTQDVFLSNSHNKKQFIDILRKELMKKLIHTHQALGDADRLIVETAIAANNSNNPSEKVVVVSADIDVLVILSHYYEENKEIYFYKPKIGKVCPKIYSNKTFFLKYPNSAKYSLFLHAFTGCDTTCAYFNKQKKNFIKMFDKYTHLFEFADAFMQPNQTEEKIIVAGIKILLAYYNVPSKFQSINSFRYNSYVIGITKSSIKSSLKLESLIPTEDASIQNFKRTYLQVQAWMGIALEPTLWGWERRNGVLYPKTMNNPPAPEQLLKNLFCQCEKGCGPRCGCRKVGMNCSVACTKCSNLGCSNAPGLDIQDDP